MPTAARRMLFVSLIMLIVLACNMPFVVAPTQDPGAAYTSAALTVAAAVNQTLVPSILPATSTSGGLNTLPPESTFTATLSPTPESSSTPSTPMISVTVDTNCRSGPGKVYDYLGGLFVGQTAQVYGKDSSGNYFYIRLPDDPSIYCWVTAQYATVVGNVSALPVFTPPPTPTPVPSFEFSFINLDSCVGWWLNFRLKNTGGTAFKSYSINVKDLNTSTTLTASANGFTELGGCLTSSTIASLEPTKVAHLSGPSFVYNPDNHKIRATITLCTLTGLGGQCVTNTITFKP